VEVPASRDFATAAVKMTPISGKRSPWLKVRNKNYSQIDRRHDLFLQRRGRQG